MTTRGPCRRRRSTRSPSTNCGRRSGAASTTPTSTNSTTLLTQARRVPRRVRADDVRRQPRRHPHRQPARPTSGTSGMRLALMLTIGGTPSVYAGDEWAYRGVKEERFGGDDAVRPEFPPHPEESEHLGHDAFRLHQHLIGLRRRHPWLHTARTSALHLANSQYVYRDHVRRRDRWWWRSTSTTHRCECRCPSSGSGNGRIVAGSGAPAEDDVDRPRRGAARLGRSSPSSAAVRQADTTWLRHFRGLVVGLCTVRGSSPDLAPRAGRGWLGRVSRLNSNMCSMIWWLRRPAPTAPARSGLGAGGERRLRPPPGRDGRHARGRVRRRRLRRTRAVVPGQLGCGLRPHRRRPTPHLRRRLRATAGRGRPARPLAQGGRRCSPTG